MNNLDRAVNLLNQIIEIETIADKEYKVSMLAQGASDKAIGESWRMFYLKALRELLTNQNLPPDSPRGAYDNKVA